MTDTILYSRSGHVARLVLNCPQRHNALGREQLRELSRLMPDVLVRASHPACPLADGAEKSSEDRAKETIWNFDYSSESVNDSNGKKTLLTWERMLGTWEFNENTDAFSLFVQRFLLQWCHTVSSTGTTTNVDCLPKSMLTA